MNRFAYMGASRDIKQTAAVMLAFLLTLTLSACGRAPSGEAQEKTDTSQTTQSQGSLIAGSVSEATDEIISTADSPTESVPSASQNEPPLNTGQSGFMPVSEAPGDTIDPMADFSQNTPTTGHTEEDSSPLDNPPASGAPNSDIVVGEDGMISVDILVGNQIFSSKFNDNPSARVLMNQMPLTLDMSDYGRQEKVIGLAFDFPTASTERPATIRSGEIYLWSGNQLVLFYTTFSNSYGGYVRIGYIEDASALASVLGSGNVTVTFKTA